MGKKIVRISDPEWKAPAATAAVSAPAHAPSPSIVDVLRAVMGDVVRDAVREALAGAAPAAPAAPALLTRAQLAAALGVCQRSVSLLVAEGMPCLLVGEARRFELGRVLAWLETRDAA